MSCQSGIQFIPYQIDGNGQCVVSDLGGACRLSELCVLHVESVCLGKKLKSVMEDMDKDNLWVVSHFMHGFPIVISGMAFMLFHCILFPSHFMHAFCWSFHAWLSLVISCMVFLWFHCMAIPNHFVHCFISVHKYLLLRNLEDIDIAWEINSLVLSDTHRSKLII